MQQVSLFVSAVPANVTAGDIWMRVAARRWGVVQDIDLLPVKRGGIRNAIVHIYDWFDHHAMNDVIQGKYLKLYYNETSYWKAIRYDPAHSAKTFPKQPQQQNHYMSNHIPQQQQQQLQHYMPQPRLTYGSQPPQKQQHYMPQPHIRNEYTPNQQKQRTRPETTPVRASRSETDRRSRGDDDRRSTAFASMPSTIDDVMFNMTKLTIHEDEDNDTVIENIEIVEDAASDDASISSVSEVNEIDDEDEDNYNDVDKVDESEMPIKPDYGVVTVPRRYRKPVRTVLRKASA